jgi:ferrous iron transport protein B
VLGDTVPDRQARWFAIKLFERDQRVQNEFDFSRIQKKEIEEIIKITEKVFKDDAESIIVNERYEFITQLVALCSGDRGEIRFTLSDKIDRIVTNRFAAIPIFMLVMWLVYFISIQTVGTMATDWMNETLFGSIIPDFVSHWLHVWQVAPWMQSLILDGIIAGCGAVLGFLPQIAVLFLCLGILEDCGYMSRIAFVMDRLFRKFGLSGKSFIPMLIATGCGVPAVMSSRTIENEKDRKITIMVTTFMPCSAKLPIIALVAGAFFPTSSWVAPSAYLLGIATIVLSGIALKKTKIFAGDAAPFIMELPSYHIPGWKNVFRYSYDRAKSFAQKAGTIIFVMNIVIWFLSSFSFSFHQVEANDSILADLGRILAPIFAPLGWGNWQGTVATLTGLVAKETIVGTFGVLFKGLGEISDNGSQVWGQLHSTFTAVSAYSFLIFNLLCAPCFAAIGAIHREMNDLKWTLIAIGYQCGLAYVVSLIVYQFGAIFFEGKSLDLGTLFAVLAVGFILYSLLKRPKRVETPVVSLSAYEKI